ncbi:hypothetical protein OCU04_008581 [Sclerotinia nivalis]|uniref:Geminivirus AL1 replication-associated protein catalytic domain-containing protein n=1 Tax=Sclerotinia nivalis TaxID=352851 RepID=A0A9X0AJF0_9HELO|nr:hypothetical protein OCU04_008581 [Sclerotinia nivalis]
MSSRMDEIIFSDAISIAPSDVSSSRSSARSSRKRTYEIHSRWVFLTYAQSNVQSKSDFELLFMQMLSRIGYDGSYYGCLEHHQDDNPGIHYHVLVHFGKQPSWTLSTARKYLCVEDDGESHSLNIVSRGQKINNFIENHVSYVEKYGDTFGVRPLVGEGRREEKKRKWEAVSAEKTTVSKLQKVKEEFPDSYYKCFNSIQSAVKYEHRGEDAYEAFELPSYIDTSRFVVPEVILQWEVENLMMPEPGRRKSLLIIGESRTGKSTLAQFIASRYGVFSEFDTEWDLNGFREGQVCAVFHDIQKGFPHWKSVFGCQASVTVHEWYAATRRMRWDVPSIWVCNRDDDPRDWGDAQRRYISGNAVVYEVGFGETLVSSLEAELWNKGGSPEYESGGAP